MLLVFLAICRANISCFTLFKLKTKCTPSRLKAKNKSLTTALRTKQLKYSDINIRYALFTQPRPGAVIRETACNKLTPLPNLADAITGSIVNQQMGQAL